MTIFSECKARRGREQTQRLSGFFLDGLAAGMNGHLGKPLDIKLMLNTLERYLAT